jgi:hypothetical protein
MKLVNLFRSLPRLGATAVVGAIISTASIAAADQTYAIKLHVSPGDKYEFDVTTTMKQKGQVTANGQVAQPIDQGFEQHRKGTVEVVAADNGMPTSLKITYDAESSNAGNVGQPLPKFPLAGRTVHVAKKDGIVSSDLGNDVDTPTVQEVAHMLEPDTSIYPKDAVAVNQEWDGDTANLAKQFQLGADDKINIHCHLLAIKDDNGRQVADIGVAGQIVKHDQGFIETKITLGGVTRVDVLTGQVVNSNVIGKIAVRGSQQSPAPDGTQVNVAVIADGEIQSHELLKLVGGGAPVAVNPAPVNPGAGFNVGNNPPPAMPNDNPLAHGGDAAAPFGGTFTGDSVSIALEGKSDQYTGTLTVGDKKYPVTARSAGGKLTGAFESDGSKFDFTASLSGNTLTLSSEGNTYTLKKPVANPLAKPAAKNPLAH